MGCADQLDAALIDRSGGFGLALPADLVDDDDLRVVILHGLDHCLVLMGRTGHLHAAGAADGRVGDIAVAADLVAGIDDDDALLFGQHAGHLAQHRRLADAGPAKEQDTVPLGDDILDDLDGAEDGTADATGQTDHLAAAVADAGDTVQRAGNAGAVVVVKRADTVNHLVDLDTTDFAVAQHALAIDITGSGHAAQVHHDLQQGIGIAGRFNTFGNAGWQER